MRLEKRSMASFIEIKNLKKHFGGHEVLNDVSLSIDEGEIVCIIGSSGSGKSTLLRCINLLEEPTEGEIIVDGDNIINGDISKEKLREKIGMVFQSFNLFENMDVLKNCMVGPIKVKGVDKAYAIQAGRELRVVVKPEEVDDLMSYQIARTIKEKIESDVQYPGTIKVTVIRETRVTEEAK